MVLAIDTALSAAQAAVVRDDVVLAVLSEPMERGHQERLAPLVAETMAAAGVAFPEIDRLAVTVGPGSFTGLRVGIAFAKGLSIALGKPCLGVGTLEALAAACGPGFVVAAIDGRRGQIYLQAFADGAPVMAPDSLDETEAAARLAELHSGGPAWLTGPGAALLEGVISARLDPRPYPDIAALALFAARGRAPAAPPRPLYLRAPDARTIAERAAG
ncbi:MAG: tRNA (adenosine(37)-N6)-threonylcarbamoyltransferase complex dimerization subunit type 1 TsaB [Caulobacterales bacterium 32-69-10]|nr:MAG: tRNA (adenosine(37)-N6)-threonylcarbamoyltransferase complex dimerization subunit type 1 TsaB [Caulobacterales bacterium 32-69-10]